MMSVSHTTSLSPLNTNDLSASFPLFHGYPIAGYQVETSHLPGLCSKTIASLFQNLRRSQRKGPLCMVTVVRIVVLLIE